jgi:hypothetical protein
MFEVVLEVSDSILDLLSSVLSRISASLSRTGRRSSGVGGGSMSILSSTGSVSGLTLVVTAVLGGRISTINRSVRSGVLNSLLVLLEPVLSESLKRIVVLNGIYAHDALSDLVGVLQQASFLVAVCLLIFFRNDGLVAFFG